MAEEKFTLIPPRENNNCFGCSETNASGLHLRFSTDGNSVVSHLQVPEHLCGWQRLVHGGVITTILDEVMGWSTIHLLKRFTLTKSITVDFLKPLYVGTPLRAEGRIIEMKNDREAIAEGLLYNQDDVLCARSRGSFALFTSKTVKRLGILDDETVEHMKRTVEG